MADTKRFSGKVAIITGGSRGIGKDCTQVFAQHGAKVVFCSNDEKEGTNTQEEINKECTDGETTFILCDVTKDQQVKNVIDKTIEKYGKLDFLLNNAGAYPPIREIDDVTSDMFNGILDLNVTGYFRFSKYALPHLRKVQGSIVNISSILGEVGIMHSVGYCASKGAVKSMTKALAIDEAVHHVRVNCICPGAIQTPLLESIFAASPDPEKSREDCRKGSLSKEIGQARDVAMACLYLAADAPFVTGSTMNVSGGFELTCGYSH